MTPAILASKGHRRYLERVWRRYPTALNRSRRSKKVHFSNRQMSKAKSAKYSKIVAEHCGDNRSLWKALNKILHRCPKMYLPGHSSIAARASKPEFALPGYWPGYVPYKCLSGTRISGNPVRIRYGYGHLMLFAVDKSVGPDKYNLNIREAVYLVILHIDVAAVGTHTNECIRSTDMRYWGR